MLAFFRKYQRYFFIVITVVIVISFSFFGTYQAVPEAQFNEEMAFRAIDGTAISRQELDETIRFIATDNDDKILFGAESNPNFLNDGVIKKDIIQTGIAELIAMHYSKDIEADLQARLQKEKNYRPYVHPEGNFVSAETAWMNFAPSLKEGFEALQASDNATSQRAFANRIKLFLAEKHFPSPILRQVLRYQEKQYSWITPDDNLNRIDLSLFGYHTTEDWFGQKFLRLAAEFIINSAKVAEQRGYRVSKEEALADLVNNSEVSFQQQLQRQQLNVATSEQYFNEQLRKMGLDQSKASKIWQKILLSRRLFQDAGSSAFVDHAGLNAFMNYAKESASGQFYQLPEELQLTTYKDLQKFEAYLNAVAKNRDSKNALALPKEFLSADEVAKKYPQLVQKKYLLEISQFDQNNLLSKARVKETLNWQLEDKNWQTLVKEFPELGVSQSKDRTARFAMLDNLTPKTRASVDLFSRKAIVKAHPEWLAEALENSESKISIVSIPLKGKGSPFVGLTNGNALISLLDKSAVQTQQEKVETKNAISKELANYSADGRHYYKIRVIERSPQKEVLTFAEANNNAALDQVLNDQLQAFYEKEREKSPAAFQKADKSWKPLVDVKDKVAERYFKNILTSIATEQKSGKILSNSEASALRLSSHLKSIKSALEKDSGKKDEYVRNSNDKASETETLTAAPALSDQWKLVAKPFNVARNQKSEEINASYAINLKNGQWSEFTFQPNGKMYFYQKLENSNAETNQELFDKVATEQQIFSDFIKKNLAKELIAFFKEQNALSTEYFDESEQITTR